MSEKLEEILVRIAAESEEQQAHILQQQNQITGLIEDMKKFVETVALQQGQISNLIETIKLMPGVQNQQ